MLYATQPYCSGALIKKAQSAMYVYECVRAQKRARQMTISAVTLKPPLPLPPPTLPLVKSPPWNPKGGAGEQN